jgi:hypothetical protein
MCWVFLSTARANMVLTGRECVQGHGIEKCFYTVYFLVSVRLLVRYGTLLYFMAAQLATSELTRALLVRSRLQHPLE